MPADLLPAHHALLEDFGAYEHAVDGPAPPMVRNHRISLEALLRWWTLDCSDPTPTSASTANLAAFLVVKADRGISARTGKAKVAALRRSYAWLLLTRTVAVDPAATSAAPPVGPPRDGVDRPPEGSRRSWRTRRH